MRLASAAFILPDDTDLRAVLFALTEIDTESAIYTQIEKFTDANVLWTVAEGADDVAETIAAVQALLPRFGLTYTEV